MPDPEYSCIGSGPSLGNDVPHTTSARGSRFEVSLKVTFLRVGAFDAQSLVTIPHAKLVRKLGMLTADQLQAVETAVRKWLGLEEVK